MFVVTAVVAVLCSALAAGLFLQALVVLLVLMALVCFVPKLSDALLPFFPFALGAMVVLLAFLFVARSIFTVHGSQIGCQNNLHELTTGLIVYENRNGTLPPLVTSAADGTPMHSWRVLILPHMQLQNLYGAYDLTEPWNGPTNGSLDQRLAPHEVYVYQCYRDTDKTRPGDTSYLAVDGPSSVWSGAKPDDPGEAILLVEVLGSGVHWVEPRDIDLRGMTIAIRQERFWGGRTEEQLTITPVNAPANAEPTWVIRNSHVAGVFVTFADGRCQLVSLPKLKRMFEAIAQPPDSDP